MKSIFFAGSSVAVLLFSGSALAQDATATGTAAAVTPAAPASPAAPKATAADGDDMTDHQRVIGHVGVTYFGVSQIPLGSGIALFALGCGGNDSGTSSTKIINNPPGTDQPGTSRDNVPSSRETPGASASVTNPQGDCSTLTICCQQLSNQNQQRAACSAIAEQQNAQQCATTLAQLRAVGACQ